MHTITRNIIYIEISGCWVHAFAGMVCDFIKGLIIKWIHGKPCFAIDYSYWTKMVEEGSRQTINMNYFHGKIEISRLSKHISISYLAIREGISIGFFSYGWQFWGRSTIAVEKYVYQTALDSDQNHISLFIFIAIAKEKGRSLLRDLVSYYTFTSHLINFQFLLLFAWMSSFAQCERHCKRWSKEYTVGR